MMRWVFLAAFGRCRKQTVDARFLPLAQALTARGHQVTMLLPSWDCPAAPSGIHEHQGVRVHRLTLGPGGRGVYPRLLWQGKRALQRWTPDVLLVSKGLGYAGWLMRWWLAQGGRALLDVDDLEDRRGWGAYRPRLVQWLLDRQEQQLLRRATGVCAASQFLADEVRGRHPHQRVLLLPNGLFRATQRARVEDNARVALLLTRGNDVAGPHLAAVWRAVLERVPDAELVVGGDWTDASAGLPRATFRGWLAGAEFVNAVRGAALCFFLPPNTPLVRAKSPARLLTCIAHGLPVVTLAVGAYADLTRTGGGVVAAEDAPLVSWLVALLRSPSLRAQHSQHIWQQAPTLSWSQRAARLDAWVTDLIHY